MTGAVPDDDLVATCVRLRGNDLIAAECRSLTGGHPDGDGVAVCRSIDEITRSAYVQLGLRVLARASSFEELVDRVLAADFEADGFRIDVHDPGGRADRPSPTMAAMLADVIPFGPDLKRPRHRLVAIVGANGYLFGEVEVSADQSYRRHDAKPWTTSSSLDSRFARALVNLVPAARSILDPCCGAGSIMLEAASLGIDVVGVDWKPAMVGMTTKNLEHFGRGVDVVRGDSRYRHHEPADAVVTDLPYGVAIEQDESTTRAIIEGAADAAPIGVYVANADISDWLRAAGYGDIEVWPVVKRPGFTRWVHRGSVAVDV